VEFFFALDDGAERGSLPSWRWARKSGEIDAAAFDDADDPPRASPAA
jgi:hypothetical protein